MQPGGESRAIADFDCNFDLEDGWIDLTLDTSTTAEALGLAGQAANRFNPLELTVSGRKLVNDLTAHAVKLSKGDPNLAAAYYTAGGIRLADLVVNSYHDEDTPLPPPAEVVPLLLDFSNAEIVGEPDVTFLDLTPGPAVRVQAVVKAKRKLGFGGQLAEYIKYAVFPPGFDTLVVVMVSWEGFERSEEIARLTDDLMTTMKVIPVDANGIEVNRDYPS